MYASKVCLCLIFFPSDSFPDDNLVTDRSELCTSVASYLWKELCTSVVSYLWKELCTSVASYLWKELCTSVASYLWKELCTSVASYLWKELRCFVSARENWNYVVLDLPPCTLFMPNWVFILTGMEVGVWPRPDNLYPTVMLILCLRSPRTFVKNIYVIDVIVETIKGLNA